MKQLPFSDPGTPDTRSPTRFLIWVGRQQLGTLLLGMTFGIVWMLAQALLPWVLGRAIDDGVGTGDTQALLAWAGALFGLGVVQAVAGTLRHRVAVSNWLQSSYRMIQVVAHHAALTGPAVRTRLTTGEVVATVSNDALRAGGAFDITARLAGAIASYFVVAAILLSASTLLGLVVLLGVPVLVASLSTVIRPLQARQREQREQVGQLTAVGADTVAGLRVLRGIGGERVFLDRYRRRSEEVRLAGVRVALPQATLDSAQVLLPGVFVVVVTGLGARLAIEGTISAGRARRVLRLRRLPRDPPARRGGGGRQGHPRARRRAADARDPADRAARRRARRARSRSRSPARCSRTRAPASSSSPAC